MASTHHVDENIVKRFWSKVEKTETCWLWQGKLNQFGYGHFPARGRMWKAHRWAYQSLVGPLLGSQTSESEYVIHHTCGVRNCVNPAHLEQMNRLENLEAVTLRPRIFFIADQI